MTIMINKPLTEGSSWTEVATGPIANVLLVGPVGGWEIYVTPNQPTSNDEGMPVTSSDGAWASSVLGAGESVYARPTFPYNSHEISIKGMMN